jgi:hypothetical protein
LPARRSGDAQRGAAANGNDPFEIEAEHERSRLDQPTHQEPGAAIIDLMPKDTLAGPVRLQGFLRSTVGATVSSEQLPASAVNMSDGKSTSCRLLSSQPG